MLPSDFFLFFFFFFLGDQVETESHDPLSKPFLQTETFALKAMCPHPKTDTFWMI